MRKLNHLTVTIKLVFLLRKFRREAGDRQVGFRSRTNVLIRDVARAVYSENLHRLHP